MSIHSFYWVFTVTYRGFQQSTTSAFLAITVTVKVKWKSLSRVRLFETPWTIQSIELFRTEYWSGQPSPSPGDLPHCRWILYKLSHQRSPTVTGPFINNLLLFTSGPVVIIWIYSKLTEELLLLWWWWSLWEKTGTEKLNNFQDHIANKRKSWDLNVGIRAPLAKLLTTVLYRPLAAEVCQSPPLCSFAF